LRELGYVEGKNVHFEIRWADGQIERLPELASDLVKQNVDVIVAQSNPAGFAAKNATTTIPIVVGASHGAVDTGLITSYDRPGGNVTGSESVAPELDAKRLEVLREMLPKAKRIAVLNNPLDQGTPLHQKWSRSTADALGLKLEFVSVQSAKELDSAFAEIARMRPDAALIFTDAGLFSLRARVVDLALKNHIPLFTEFRQFTELGGLMSYGPSLAGMYRIVARHVDKILKGAKPADLPFERPTEFEFYVNRKTAKVLDITIPQTTLLRADRVIE
jgi:putative ABC transport system substrate-binding protein